MYVDSMYVHAYTLNTCMHIYMCMDISLSVYMYIGRHAWAYMCECMYINTHFTHICMDVCMFMYTCCMTVYILVCI